MRFLMRVVCERVPELSYCNSKKVDSEPTFIVNEVEPNDDPAPTQLDFPFEVTLTEKETSTTTTTVTPTTTTTGISQESYCSEYRPSYEYYCPNPESHSAQAVSFCRSYSRVCGVSIQPGISPRILAYCRDNLAHFNYYCPDPLAHGAAAILFCPAYQQNCGVRRVPDQ